MTHLRLLPLGMLLVALSAPSWAQDSSSAPAKKVWTNEDVEALRNPGDISVVGKTAAPSVKSASAPAKPAGGKDAKWYRAQLKSLYDKIPPIDAEIDEMHRFQDGSYQSPGGIPMRYYGKAPLNPADSILQLEKQKRDILDRIDTLQDEARHAGILPGELR